MSASFPLGPLRLLLSVATLGLAGCASSQRGTGSPRATRFPAVLSERWTPPVNATRLVDGEPSAVFAAAARAAETMGFVLDRRDAARGRLSAARRQSTGFDGARQDTLELTATLQPSGAVEVAVVFRVAAESGGMVTSALVRDRAPYDVLFARLVEGLTAVAP